ncbi:YpsA SLOG family protein [Thermodesulfobacteriota bacterium]
MIKKIISGGQTGAGRAALDAAIKLKFPYGGWISKRRRTEDGILPYKYKLKELKSAGYPNHTERNVMDADGILIVSHGKLIGGSVLPRKLAEKYKRPCLHIDLNKTPTFMAAPVTHSWIDLHKIEILNVAGPRANKNPEIYQDVKYIIEGVILLGLAKAESDEHLTDYNKDEYLKKFPVPPKTVDEAVERLLSDLDLQSKVAIANMDLDDLINFQSTLFTYFKNAFGMWSGNTELLESCRLISKEPVRDEKAATGILIGVLMKKLRETHTLRVVK